MAMASVPAPPDDVDGDAQIALTVRGGRHIWYLSATQQAGSRVFCAKAIEHWLWQLCYSVDKARVARAERGPGRPREARKLFRHASRTIQHKVSTRLMSSFSSLKAGPEKSARRRQRSRIAAQQQQRETRREREREQERRRGAPGAAFEVYDAGGSGSSSSDDDYLQDHTYLSRYYANHHSTPEASPPGTPAK